MVAGGDVIALIEFFGVPAMIVGNSMGAGAAVWAAAERPDLVSGPVLLGAFVRGPPMNPFLAFAFRAAMAGPWAPRVWASPLAELYPGRRPDDVTEHRNAIAASMRRAGYAGAFSGGSPNGSAANWRSYPAPGTTRTSRSRSGSTPP